MKEPMSIADKLKRVSTANEILMVIAASIMSDSPMPNMWALIGAIEDLTLVLADLETEHDRLLSERLAPAEAT